MDQNESLISDSTVEQEFLGEKRTGSIIKFHSEERKKRQQEVKRLKKYQRKLKMISIFFLFFALFILLNCCIGFSSAPFYEKNTTCKRVEPTP